MDRDEIESCLSGAQTDIANVLMAELDQCGVDISDEQLKDALHAAVTEALEGIAESLVDFV